MVIASIRERRRWCDSLAATSAKTKGPRSSPLIVSTKRLSLYAQPKRSLPATASEAVMVDRNAAETLKEAQALFETVGMPTCNLAFRPDREYSHDLLDLLSYLTREGQAVRSFA